MAARFTANCAPRVNRSVCDLRALPTKILGGLFGRKNKNENDSRLLKNSEGNRHGQGHFCPENEANIALFLQVTRIGKIRKIFVAN